MAEGSSRTRVGDELNNKTLETLQGPKDYRDWAQKMKETLIEMGLWQAVAARDTVSRNNTTARWFIISRVDYTILDDLEAKGWDLASSAHDTWFHIHQMMLGPTLRSHMALTEWWNIDSSSFTTIRDFMDRFQQLDKAMSDSGTVMPDQAWVFRFLAAIESTLPFAYSHWQRQIKANETIDKLDVQEFF
ncbi:uncharacterized protein J7T54_005650 [Emericellopsis cladophorae]|uniref:DUF4219 domain-containing protein n=1 Tax=Emericellopsis cladophorae TaxID=2686198 RepID=A0A9Q0BG53_9HYPO|nr:uncharacterized protein J7T54_005650 [Emericellopsis cladophorae]KAI6783621.1 hypothetical protein J7T54_005650 [Emericellopsis cladophorae]